MPSGLNYSLESHLSSWFNTSCPHLLSRAGSSVLCTVPALKISQHLWVGRVNSLSFPAMTLFLRDLLPPNSPASSQVVFHLSVGSQNLLSTQNILCQKLFTIFFSLMLLVSSPHLIFHDTDLPVLHILTSFLLSKWRSFPCSSLGNYFTDKHWALFLLECSLVEFSVCFQKQPPNLCRLFPSGPASLSLNTARPSSTVISSTELPPPKPVQHQRSDGNS